MNSPIGALQTSTNAVAELIASSILDGVFLLKETRLLYVNPIGERILEQYGIEQVLKSLSRTIPLDFEVGSEDQRTQHYLVHSYPISLPETSAEETPDTVILAQDVTLVKEGEDAKAHFIATLSHEVKTPVTSLTMAIRLLNRSIDQFQNATHRTLIETCVKDIDRLRSLIEELLSVSRFDSAESTLNLTQADLGRLMRQYVQSYKIKAAERGIDVTFEYDTSGGAILLSVDAAKLSWAISNLMTNALRHTPRGGSIFVKVSRNAAGDAEVSIKDSGSGIDRLRQARIFDKFNPYYDLRVARTGSIGMGLAVAKDILTAHGGRIWVVSEPGKGAEFHFTLPIGGKQFQASEKEHKC